MKSSITGPHMFPSKVVKAKRGTKQTRHKSRNTAKSKSQIPTKTLDAFALANQIKDWEQLSDDKFYDKGSRLLDTLKCEAGRREGLPDDSYVRAVKAGERPPRIN